MRHIDLDRGAARPLAPAVLNAMLPFFTQHYGNASSFHALGEEPRRAVDAARNEIAGLIAATAGEVVLTSCASESNNHVIKGVASARRKQGNHIIASAIEHFSVLNPLRTLSKAGFNVTLLPVNEYGQVDPGELEAVITSDTILISIMTANPEIGTIQPIKQLTEVARSHGIPFHSDATAAAGWIPLDVKDMGVDFLSLAGDQLGGPKGSGALYVRRGTRLLPLLEGGTQEAGLRAGTENVPAIVGFGKAARLAQASLAERAHHVSQLRDSLKESLFGTIDHLHLNGHPIERLPHNLHFSVEFVEGEALLLHLNMAGIYVSSGSSCSSQALKSSHVLAAIGLSAALAQGSLLLTVDEDSRAEDIPYICQELGRITQLLRNMSPLYSEWLREGKQ